MSDTDFPPLEARHKLDPNVPGLDDDVEVYEIEDQLQVNYRIRAGDHIKILVCKAAAATTVVIPAGLDFFPVGDGVSFVRKSTAPVTIVAEPGATVETEAGVTLPFLLLPDAGVRITKTAANRFKLTKGGTAVA